MNQTHLPARSYTGISQWLMDPTAIPFLHAADFWFGALGFLITIATFALGWRKLIQVQKAADAARIAVEDVKLRVSRYDATVDASEALHSYRDILRHLDSLDWRAVVHAMSSVRRSALRMDQPLNKIDVTTARDLRRAAKMLSKHIAVIEEAISTASAYPDDYVIRASVRAGEDALTKAVRIIEDSIS